MIYLAAVVMLAGTTAAIWWVRGRRHLHLADALDAPWWLFPLMQLAVYWYFKRQAHKDLFMLCGWIKKVGDDLVPSLGAARMISIRRDDDGGFRVKIKVKRGFPQGDDEPDGRTSRKMQVVNHAKGSLALGPVDYEWKFRLWASCVILTRRKVVPKVAPGMKPDIAAVVAANLAADTVVPALGAGDRPITHSTTDDASHVLLSGTTMGGGKSETLKTFGLQSYAPSILSGRNIPGADLLIIDTTRKFSHTGWAINYRTRQPWPGIVIATELDQAAHYLVLAAQAMEERGRITQAAKTKGEQVEWSRLLIMLDDSNGLHQQLKSHGYDDALEAISMLLWHARGVNMYMISAFQRGSARAAGGGDNREAYGCRIWADGSEKTGDMVADAVDKKTRPKPKPHKVQPGHSVFIYGSLAFEAQRIIYTDDEARRVCRMEARRRMRQALPGAGGTQPPQRQAHSNGNRQQIGPHQQRPDEDAGNDQVQLPSHGSVGQLEPANLDEHPPGDHRDNGGAGGNGRGTDHGGSDGDHSQDHDEDGEERRSHGLHHSRPDDGSQPRWLTELAATDGWNPRGRGYGPDPQPLGGTTLRPPTTSPTPRCGFHPSVVAEVSVQAIPAISRIDDADGDVNYLTLRDIAGREWCPYPYNTVRAWARDSINGADFPDSVPGFSNPRRWSERAVREWIEDYQSQGGAKAWGVYFAWKPGDATAKVGFTGNLRARRKKWNYHEDWIRRWVPCGSEREARDMETKMHRKYHDCHEELEWFRVYDKDGNLTRLGRDLDVPEVVRS